VARHEVGTLVLDGRQERVRTRDGRHLAAVVAGTGTPTVVLEAGLGGSSSSWLMMWEALAARTRVVAYDRSGLGNSLPDKAPRTLTRMTEDLVEVVEALGEGPVVVVGHSMGGALVRALACTRPDLVRGVMLIDPVHEDAALYTDPKYTKHAAINAQLGLLVSRLRLMRPMMAKSLHAVLENAPAGKAAALVDELSRVSTVKATNAEAQRMIEGLDELRRLTARHGRMTVPVTVVSADEKEERRAAVRADINALNGLLAAASTDGREVVLEGGHLLPQEHPDAVVEEVLDLLDRVRAVRTV